MPSTDNEHQEPPSLRQKQMRLASENAPLDIEGLVNAITFEGNLAALIACACEKALDYETLSYADPGTSPHSGVRAAVTAYADWKRTKEGSMDMDVRPYPGNAKLPVIEPETLPLSLAGKWVAWSSDGMRIIASSETSEEAERLAIDSGELEPILERHPGRYRL